MDITQENVNKLMHEANGRAKERLAGCINVYQSIRWKKVAFQIPTNPEPSHRPRLSGFRVYVPGAAKHQAFFNKHVLPNLKNVFVSTPCKIDIELYVQTPKSFSIVQKILAEMKILRPWGNIGDVDNFEKTVLDSIQPNEKRGHSGILENDSLVVESHTKKFYSMTPRTEVVISYMGKIPDELAKILRLTKKE